MAQQHISVGSGAPPVGGSDNAESGFVKAEANFTDLYAQIAAIVAQESTDTANLYADNNATSNYYVGVQTAQQTSLNAINDVVYNTISPHFVRIAAYGTPGTFTLTIPTECTVVRVQVCGGGGAGGGGGATYGWSGAGGGAGGYGYGIVAVTPGGTYGIVVGAGGPSESIYTGGAGGTSTFQNIVTATGGTGGYGVGQAYPYGGIPGTSYGGAIAILGGFGDDGSMGAGVTSDAGHGGRGGSSYFGGGGRTGDGQGTYGPSYGSGGGGCYNTAGNGGQGQVGLVIVEY